MDKKTVTFDFTDFREHKVYCNSTDTNDQDELEELDEDLEEELENYSLIAQDMIMEVKTARDCSVEDAIKYVINKDNTQAACRQGFGDIAFEEWGHGDDRGPWGYGRNPYKTLDNLTVTVELTEEQVGYLDRTLRKYKYCAKDYTMALCLLLVFEMERMGHHI